MTPKDKGIERRKHARRDVLETFHVFLIIPKLGQQKIYLRDLSEGGMSLVAEDEDPLKLQDVVSCFLHINPNLKLPLSFKVSHVKVQEDGTKRLGCEFDDTSSSAYKTYVKFLSLLDDLAAFLDQ